MIYIHICCVGVIIYKYITHHITVLKKFINLLPLKTIINWNVFTEFRNSNVLRYYVTDRCKVITVTRYSVPDPFGVP